MNDGHEHIKLVLRSLPSGQQAVVIVKKATADFLGWTNHFPTYTEWADQQEAIGVPVNRQYRRHEPRALGGKPVRIGRGTNKSRNEAGLTHIFRVGSKVTIRDMAELASFTEVDWHWMERPCGTRMDRQWWWERYLATP